MNEFSKRTVEDLRRHKLFKLLLPAFTSFLKINVNKEIEKDRQIILRARTLQIEDRTPTSDDIQGLLQYFREIDRKFLQDISTLASSIVIHYDDLERHRKMRIEKTLDMVYRIFRQWERDSRFRTAVTSIYKRDEFIFLVTDIFKLYINETRMLSESVKIPRKLLFTRDALVRKVSSVMDAVAIELTEEITDWMFAGIHR